MFTSIPSTVQLDTDELDFLNIEPYYLTIPVYDVSTIQT